MTLAGGNIRNHSLARLSACLSVRPFIRLAFVSAVDSGELDAPKYEIYHFCRIERTNNCDRKHDGRIQ